MHAVTGSHLVPIRKSLLPSHFSLSCHSPMPLPPGNNLGGLQQSLGWLSSKLNHPTL